MSKARTVLITALAISLLAGSTIGATAQEEPVEVAGSVTLAGSIERWDTDDPRLSGDGTWDPAEGNTREPSPTTSSTAATSRPTRASGASCPSPPSISRASPIHGSARTTGTSG